MKLIEGAFDFGDADECNIDGVSGIYQISQNTICFEYFANKIVDGKVNASSSCSATGTAPRGSQASSSSRECSPRSRPCPPPPREHEERVH
jgi:hypothetical protein